MVNYERTAARRMLGKAYEKAGLADLDNKSWVLEKQQAFFSRLTPDNQTRWKQLAYENPDLAKQAYAEISSSDFNTINKIVQYMWSNMSTKDFDDMLSQVAQPKGGTENLTNVASPGQPPAKVSAVTDNKDGSTYGREAHTLPGEPRGGFYDSQGRYSDKVDYAGPGAFVSGSGPKTVQFRDGPQSPYGKEQSSTDNPHTTGMNHGPVGEAGVNSRTDDYQATKPGTLHPRYSQFPSAKIPSIPKNAGVSFTKVMDDSVYKTIPRDTYQNIETTPGKPNSSRTYIGKEVRPLATTGIISKRRKGVAGEHEGDAVTEGPSRGHDWEAGMQGIGHDTRNSPNRTFEPEGAGDGTSDYLSPSIGRNQSDDPKLDDLARNDAAKALRAKRLVERFMASKGTASTFLETARDSFPQPVQVTEEDDDERNSRLETLAEEEDEEALKDLKYGYTQSAMLHREKAAKCRAAMSKGYTLGNMLRKSVLKE